MTKSNEENKSAFATIELIASMREEAEEKNAQYCLILPWNYVFKVFSFHICSEASHAKEVHSSNMRG